MPSRPVRLSALLGVTALLSAACTDSPTAPDTLDCESDYPRLALGSSVSGTITDTDTPLQDGTFYDAYSMPVEEDGTVTLRMTSSEVDSFVFLLSSTEQFIAADDDSGGGAGGNDAQLVHEVTRACYVVVANTFEPGTGAYTLSASFD